MRFSGVVNFLSAIIKRIIRKPVAEILQNAPSVYKVNIVNHSNFKTEEIIQQSATFNFGNFCKIIIHSEVMFDKSNRQSKLPMIKLNDNTFTGDFVELNISIPFCMNIGREVSIQDNSKIIGEVILSNYCILAPNCYISSGNHHYNIAPHLNIREQDKLAGKNISQYSKAVFIEEDCWLGKDVGIFQGATLGRGVVVGANSLVKGYVAPYSVIAGSPAKTIKQRLNFNPPKSLKIIPEHFPYFYRGFETLSKYYKNNVITDFLFSESNSHVVLAKIDKVSVFRVKGEFLADEKEMTIIVNGCKFNLKSETKLFDFHIEASPVIIQEQTMNEDNLLNGSLKMLSEEFTVMSFRVISKKLFSFSVFSIDLI